MKLFIAPGNPGKQYAKTRHNSGWMVFDAFVKAFDGNFSDFRDDSKLKASVSTGMIAQEKILLAKPLDYYNNTGRVAAALMRYYDLTADDLIVVHDDIDLSIGTFRISHDSQAAGNNGVQSVIDALGTKKFTRIRIGIFNTTKEHADAKDFVLNPFSRTDAKAFKELLPRIQEAMIDIVEYHPSIEKVQNIYN